MNERIVNREVSTTSCYTSEYKNHIQERRTRLTGTGTPPVCPECLKSTWLYCVCFQVQSARGVSNDSLIISQRLTEREILFRVAEECDYYFN